MRTAKTDQTGWMPRLIWVFAGHTLILLVLPCRDSNNKTLDVVEKGEQQIDNETDHGDKRLAKLPEGTGCCGDSGPTFLVYECSCILVTLGKCICFVLVLHMCVTMIEYYHLDTLTLYLNYIRAQHEVKIMT